MKKKFTSIASGLSAVSLLAFALAACVSENISAPTGNTTCNCDAQSSSSCDIVPRSSSATDIASSSDEVLPNSSEDVQPASSSSDIVSPSSSSIIKSSSSVAASSSARVASSSSRAASSSSKKMECITMSKLCPPCDADDCPISAMPCSQCYNQYGAETYDCETNERYICSRSDTWDRTCYNLTDSTGNIAKDSCSLNFGAWLDCKTNMPFVCKEGHWERLPEEYSWVHQKCDRIEADRQINIEYETEKGSIARIASLFYCDGIYWRQGGTSTPERHLCEIEGDKVTIKGKTYHCLGGEWSL